MLYVHVSGGYTVDNSGVTWGKVGSNGDNSFGASPDKAGDMRVFLGQFRHNLDTKGRLTLPARYREQLSEGVVLTRGFDRCLLVYPMVGWMPLAERVSALSISDPDVRKLRRMIFSQAVDAQPDRQGRILVPADLRSHSRIQREVLLVGMHNFVEIWSPEEWATQNEVLDREAPIIAERLAELI